MKRRVFSFIVSSYFSYLTAFVGVFLSMIIAWQSALWIEKYEEDYFNTTTERVLFLLKKELQANVQMMYGSTAFFKSSQHISKEDWSAFVDAHALKKQFPSIEVVAYAPIVANEKRVQYEKKMRAEGVSNYTIFPSNFTELLVPITFIEPFTPINAKAVGFNMGSDSLRQGTIEKAIERGIATLSPKIEFIFDTSPEDKIGFIVVAPIFKSGVTLESYEQKKEHILGFIIVGIRAKALFEDVLRNALVHIDYEIYDGGEIKESFKLYDSAAGVTNVRFKRTSTIDLYGREWTLHFKANDVLGMHWSRNIPFVQAFFGILFSFVLGRWLYALQRTREEAHCIAEEKTRLLARSEAEMRTLFQAMHEGIVVQNAQGIITECNLAAQEIFGATKEEMVGKTSAYAKWSAIREDGSAIPASERPAPQALSTGEVQENVIMGIRRADGTITWVQANAQPIFSDNFSHVESVIVTFSDITQYRKSKLKLEEYIAIIDANVIISSTDLEGIITEVSEAFCTISGYTKEELLGKNHNIVRHSDMPTSFYEQMWETLKSGKRWFGEIKNRHKNGSDYWVEATIAPRFDDLGIMVGFTAIRHDITDKKRIEELSITDKLTGLYNRLKLDELLTLHVNMALRYETPFSAIMLDVDKFKSVNDTFGHQVGDTLLQEIAQVLKANVRIEDILGRWGGEEFLILLPSTTREGAVALAQKLREAVESTHFSIVGKKTASFGVATYHAHDDAKTIIGRADEALYRAKEGGRNRVEVEIHTCELPA